MAHRSGRVIDTDMRFSLVSHVSSDGQEHEQDSEDNPNMNAHQSRPAAVFPSIERLATGRRYLCFHFARSTIRRISALESTLSMSLGAVSGMDSVGKIPHGAPWPSIPLTRNSRNLYCPVYRSPPMYRHQQRYWSTTSRPARLRQERSFA